MNIFLQEEKYNRCLTLFSFALEHKLQKERETSQEANERNEALQNLVTSQHKEKKKPKKVGRPSKKLTQEFVIDLFRFRDEHKDITGTEIIENFRKTQEAEKKNTFTRPAVINFMKDIIDSGLLKKYISVSSKITPMKAFMALPIEKIHQLVTDYYSSQKPSK